MKNQWQSPDALDPFLTWELVLPLTQSAQRFDFVDEILALCAQTRLVRIREVALAVVTLPVTEDPRHYGEVARSRSLLEVLPFQEALCGGDGRVVIESTVFVRDQAGAIIERDASDAGALLRSLEPDADAAWARRFATSHPFVGLWSTTTGGELRVTFAFWCTLLFDESDEELLQRNRPRLQGLHDGLQALARRSRGSVDAPVALLRR